VTVVCTTNRFALRARVEGLRGNGLKLRNGTEELAVPESGSVSFESNVASGQAYEVTVSAQPESPWQTCVVSNGAGRMAGAEVEVDVSCSTETFPLRAEVTGLTGSGLMLTLDGGAPLSVATNGTVTLASERESGTSFAISVSSQPTGQICTVSGGTGTVAGSEVVAQVTCAQRTYAVRLDVTGLAGSGLRLSLNGGTALEIPSAGLATFPAQLASGQSFSVEVVAQPQSPWQDCTLASSSGVVGEADVLLTVSCTTRTFAVAAAVSGLSGQGLVLRNGTDTVEPGGNGRFPFTQRVASGAAYLVTVGAQPTAPWQTCTASESSGTVQGADITVPVSCTTNAYAVRGTVTGLQGGTVTLANNGALLEVDADGPFAFPANVESGQGYDVEVSTQPDHRFCVVNRGQGTIADADIQDVVVTCHSFLNSERPTIAGEARVFATLTAEEGTWSGANPAFAFQWERCAPSGSPCTDIVEATSRDYTVTKTDFGHTLRIRVTATANEEEVAVESAATLVVSEPSCPNPQTLAARPPRVAESVLASHPWEGADQVFTDDGVEAVAGPLGPGEHTDVLEVRGFGFNLPASAKIRHIRIDVERASQSGLLTDHLVEIDTDQSGSSNLAKPQVRWPTASEVVSYGGAGTNLGAPFPAASVNAETFTVRIAARNDETSGTDQARIDRVSVTVTYLDASLAGPYTASQIASVEDPTVQNEAPWGPLTPETLATADGSYVATGDFVANGKSEWLVATGFGVALPPTAQPTGVIVEVVRQATVFDWAIRTDTARLVKGGTPQAEAYTFDGVYDWVKEPAWQTSSFGNSSDLWNTTSLTNAEATDPGFGVALRLRANIGSAVAGMHGRLDALRLWVAYDPVEKSATSSPTVSAQKRVGVAWDTPENIQSADGAEARAQLVDGWVSDFLRARDFGFEVPQEAWVSGISVDLKHHALSGGYIADRIVRLGGVPEARANRARDSSASWPSSVVDHSYGGATDRWGAGSIEPALVNASTFAIDLSTRYLSTGGNDHGYVDSLTATVTYCMP